MFVLAIFVLLLFAAAIGFAWLADNPGTLTITWPWMDQSVEMTLLEAIIGLAAIIALVMMVWWVISGILHSPQAFGRWRSGRRRDKGYEALSKGLVAAGAGNAPLARRLSKESAKLLNNEPLVALLDAQTALLEGKRPEARKKFETMLEADDTRLLGLRGLYVEAEQQGEAKAAAHFAKQANEHTPGTPWAAQAVLKVQTLSDNWVEALKTLDHNRSSGLYEKDEFNRKRSVLLTALALSEEDANPDKAKTHALAAHKLAPGLVPAAVVAARAASRLGDMRKAAKVLEASWKLAPHPDVATAYVGLRVGDSSHDRLAKAQTLNQKRIGHPEGQFAIAHAAVDANEWKIARDAMESILRSHPTERACLLMADIEEAEHGDRGRVREWLARAVTAPRDAAWTADGVVSDNWAPYSPVTGQLDAFEWKVPVEQLGKLAGATDYSQLAHQPLEELKPEPIVEETASKIVDAFSVGVGAAVVVDAISETSETTTEAPVAADESDIEDAVIIEEVPKAEEALEKTEPEETPSNPDAATKDEEPVSTEGATEESPPAEAVPLGLVSQPGADKESTEESANDNKAKTSEPNSPYANPNLDEDEDGVIDRRPDDPGISANAEPPKKKGLFF